ncbi:hypothetical protein Ga0074115_1599 [endosymbiont of Ridgeia piscesae]|uniref:Uncharacterized protein n=2 Tax=endosymbiont of Ridgeia piscesae TaxID=54398 RepID=A0A0T5Z1Y1_9GAMM|nr:hypothetical protein Ga0074115_1599 [endosymbiont of Ridgeia piscesae]KRT58762.1 hypothetical protein Ga0076813_14189 [endosymbiont of Ridgeia piscesae]
MDIFRTKPVDQDSGQHANLLDSGPVRVLLLFEHFPKNWMIVAQSTM